jgi:hypothetical protein
MALQSLKRAFLCVYGTEGQGFESLLARKAAIRVQRAVVAEVLATGEGEICQVADVVRAPRP